MNPILNAFDVKSLPGILSRKLVEAALELFQPPMSREDLPVKLRCFGTGAPCPIDPKHRLCISPVSASLVDVFCEGGCAPGDVAAALHDRLESRAVA
jgi:hypothetical protein